MRAPGGSASAERKLLESIKGNPLNPGPSGSLSINPGRRLRPHGLLVQPSRPNNLSTVGVRVRLKVGSVSGHVVASQNGSGAVAAEGPHPRTEPRLPRQSTVILAHVDELG
jgi:hypothetical protein